MDGQYVYEKNIFPFAGNTWSMPDVLLFIKRYLQIAPAVFYKGTCFPDLLEAGREHMHQVTPDEFCVAEGDRLARFVRSFLPSGKVHLLLHDRKDAVVRIATLCVYLPRYSIALPNPLNVSLM